MSSETIKSNHKNIPDIAVSTFKEGFNCAQSVLAAYAEQLGLDRSAALRLAAAFGGGIARTGETCGAVTGALMAIGLKFAAGRESKEKVIDISREFIKAFKARNKTVICRELLGFDISTPEGMKASKDKILIDNLCPKFVGDAAEILGEILKKH